MNNTEEQALLDEERWAQIDKEHTMETVQITPPDTASLLAIIEESKQQITELADRAENLVVNDDDSARDITDMVVMFLDWRDQIEAATKAASKPYQAIITQIKGLSVRLIAETGRGEAGVKGALLPYFEGIIEEEPLAKPKVKTGAATSYTTSRDTLEVDEDKLPDEYFTKTPDTKRIKADLKADIEIPGAVLKKTHSVAIRRTT